MLKVKPEMASRERPSEAAMRALRASNSFGPKALVVVITIFVRKLANGFTVGSDVGMWVGACTGL